MKQLKYFLLALPLMAFAFTACNDTDDDNPQVNIEFTYSGSVISEDQVYVVQPDTFSIDSIAVTAVRAGHKAMCVGPVNYWIDGAPVATNFFPPFGVEIPSDRLSIGSHILTAQMGIAEEGYALAQAVASIRINVVADSADIPVPATGTRTTMDIDYHLQ